MYRVPVILQSIFIVISVCILENYLVKIGIVLYNLLNINMTIKIDYKFLTIKRIHFIVNKTRNKVFQLF